LLKHLRIFLSSPGDVNEERAKTLKVIEELSYDPSFRGKITLEGIAWDKANAGTPMLATMSPQEVVNQNLLKPSECDIVVVIFGTRMGTPLPEKYIKPEEYRYPTGTGWDDKRYLSGTEWEYIDALQAAQKRGLPIVTVYRRIAPVSIDPGQSLQN
jgi:hypothetical protein